MFLLLLYAPGTSRQARLSGCAAAAPRKSQRRCCDIHRPRTFLKGGLRLTMLSLSRANRAELQHMCWAIQPDMCGWPYPLNPQNPVWVLPKGGEVELGRLTARGQHELLVCAARLGSRKEGAVKLQGLDVSSSSALHGGLEQAAALSSSQPTTQPTTGRNAQGGGRGEGGCGRQRRRSEGRGAGAWWGGGDTAEAGSLTRGGGQVAGRGKD
mmetsp:Transcript_29089/g.64251  ORF Transcript_29089/g.64251 Transcript_29089/m.64251 type:complete len:211 (-) Transcript_29089:1421-2053(-)